MDRFYGEIKAYVNFREEDMRALRELGPLLAPRFTGVVDDFYGRIEAHPEAVRVITGGQAQIERLKGTLVDFLNTFFSGPWDNAYIEQRARIGRRHVQVGLDQHYMITALAAIREHLCRGASEVTAASARPLLMRRLVAINKLCDLELAIMLHTYREDTLARLKASERLATFGQLMSAICHELRNPLGVIETSSFLLRQRVGETDTESLPHLLRIQRHVRRCTRIITNMLDIVRERPATVRPLLARDLAQRAGQLLHEEVGRDASVRCEQPELRVQADPDLVQQILGNLLQNAADATSPPDDVIRLSIRARGSQVEFLVEDNGPGVALEVRTRLFEPLVTTKEMGVGLGLALSTKLAVQQHGSLTLTTGTLGGAAFCLTLPGSVT